MLKSCALAISLGALLASNAFAQEQQQSFKALIGRGFEIKSVTFARGESTDNRDAVLVTLQKDKAVAVCFFAATTWINLNTSTLEDARRCDVR
jgi:hypothetical protein